MFPRLVRKAFAAAAAFLWGCLGTAAQVRFPAGAGLCEQASWKLVFQDEFGGNRIDTNAWYLWYPDWIPSAGSYLPYASTVESRAKNNEAEIYVDENVLVSEGTCRLVCKRQNVTWYPAGGPPVQRRFTSGIIHSKTAYRRGRMVIRCRLPSARGSWPAFWATTGKSEIDVFEYYPGRKKRRMETNLHRWHENGSHLADRHAYKLNNPQDWHEYAVEWDSAFIRFYTDGALKVTQHKYEGGDPSKLSSCVPDANVLYTARGVYPQDTWHSVIANFAVDPGAGKPFSYRNRVPRSDARLQIDGQQMEIDYIRIYQREPQPGAYDLCDSIEGSRTLCLNTVYNYRFPGADPALFELSPGLEKVYGGKNRVSLRALKQGTAWIKVLRKNPACGNPEAVIVHLTIHEECN